eukprot:210944-Amphidinium_carterae.2
MGSLQSPRSSEMACEKNNLHPDKCSALNDPKDRHVQQLRFRKAKDLQDMPSPVRNEVMGDIVLWR